ncbi:Scr1 family TA system antitoxin-like transcriptional regulator [Marinitenerispora sediminis]|uniref:Scr1 family TA system antitoxin-like transcriptional regulator n=1 Tax=Marinitenerispora sediminis TaxID=1931232 RepID=UPI002277C15E|nr:Scr1 family TA system antitoxin-like transcriptional regulator [Marinitenerispora sediminis]
MGLESDARRIQRYDASQVPGLFQTEDYQRAMMRGSIPEVGDEEIERRIQVRMERQRVWTQNWPQTWVIIDEAVIHRVVGGPETMHTHPVERGP